ncbi:hypothetical protein ACFL35_03295 [Candidatus Riflebacteria bacterium]
MSKRDIKIAIPPSRGMGSSWIFLIDGRATILHFPAKFLTRGTKTRQVKKLPKKQNKIFNIGNGANYNIRKRATKGI